MTFSERQLLWTSVAFRLLNCALVQTWFVPDEHYQSLEPAHVLAFGHGHLTWEWAAGLRSYIYPFVIAVYYRLLAVAGLDSRQFLLVQGPRVLQSLFAALGDVYLFKLSKLFGGEKEGFLTLVVYWLSWFGFFCMPRTLTNSIETVLTVVALYYYPWPAHYLHDSVNTTTKGTQRKLLMYLTVAAIAVLIRPTAILFWAPLVLWNLLRAERKLQFLLKICFPLGAVILFVATLVDRVGYGRWLLSWWNFAQFNVFQGGSGHFGVHPWYWYALVGLPSVLTTHTLPILMGIQRAGRRRCLLAALCAWYVLFHSLLAHKEHRFLLPIVPILCLYAGHWLCGLTIGKGKASGGIVSFWGILTKPNVILLLLFLTNMPVALYTGLIHQRAPIDVVKYAHSVIEEKLNENRSANDISLWLMLPCYSTPLFGHIHWRIDARFLTCEPNLAAVPNYVDESDRFHAAPLKWLHAHFPKVAGRLPDQVVVFEWLWLDLNEWFASRGYSVCKKLFNAHFLQGACQSHYMVVLCRQ